MRQFRLIGTNHIQKFSALMSFHQITPEQAVIEGIDENLAKELDEKARSVGLAIIAIPSDMFDQFEGKMTTMEWSDEGVANLDEKSYTFINMSGDRAVRNGIMIPVEITDKPDRDEPIGDDDIDRLKKLMDNCKDFDEFLMLI